MYRSVHTLVLSSRRNREGKKRSERKRQREIERGKERERERFHPDSYRVKCLIVLIKCLIIIN